MDSDGRELCEGIELAADSLSNCEVGGASPTISSDVKGNISGFASFLFDIVLAALWLCFSDLCCTYVILCYCFTKIDCQTTQCVLRSPPHTDENRNMRLCHSQCPSPAPCFSSHFPLCCVQVGENPEKQLAADASPRKTVEIRQLSN